MIHGSMVLVGKPNVGKSTLLNTLLNIPLAIISPKPQTTVYLVRGIANIGSRQILCIDTPGIHRLIHQERNRHMNRIAHYAMRSHDLVLALFKAGSWDREDENMLSWLNEIEVPKIAVITHIDTVDHASLQTTVDHLSKLDLQGIVPISAVKNRHLDMLNANILCLMPAEQRAEDQQDPYHSDGFIAQEMLREQIMNQLHQEIPYAVTIEILTCKRTVEKLIIHANLIVTKSNHKKILVGENGCVIKSVGMLARKRISQLLNTGVELRLWVQQKERPKVYDIVE